MKKFGLLLVGGIAAIVLLSTIGPLVGLAVSLVILYFILKQFLKTERKMAKVGLAILGIIVLLASIHNVPAIVGVIAAAVLYLVYKKWNTTKHTVKKTEDDPFVNFEKQWNELKHN
ncbi:flagellar basal body rod protein [Bacillus sp. EB600]|uniref:lmo0954 family membrane protein n=1 Tax=Bacillus sp. EB600 TaxID=2806345 RepID=UPI00210BF5E1|nr:flagellar basal body rod protein [Bacillus sp. EB600]MCQ6282439.1 flagellar basal body rod protein [Bacillus sp. EB600]